MFLNFSLFKLQGDLAARNVLLTHDMKAKIADFGLSTRIYFNTTERKGPVENMVPIRWAAFEVLYGSAAIIELSDVWSYGVFMWELFYLGSAVPYGDKKDFEEILDFLKKGHRLRKPPMCPEYIYDLMLDCWFENHLYRPTFKQLKSQLKAVVPEKNSPPIINPVQHNNITYLDVLPQKSTEATTVENYEGSVVYHKFKGTISSNDGELLTQNVLKYKSSSETTEFSKHMGSVENLSSCNRPITNDDNEDYMTEYSEPAFTGTISSSEQGYITMPEMMSLK